MALGLLFDLKIFCQSKLNPPPWAYCCSAWQHSPSASVTKQNWNTGSTSFELLRYAGSRIQHSEAIRIQLRFQIEKLGRYRYHFCSGVMKGM